MNTALCSTRSMLMHLVRGYALYANALVRGLLKEYNSQKNNTLSVYEYRSILYALYPLCMNKNNALRAQNATLSLYKQHSLCIYEQALCSTRHRCSIVSRAKPTHSHSLTHTHTHTHTSTHTHTQRGAGRRLSSKRKHGRWSKDCGCLLEDRQY